MAVKIEVKKKSDVKIIVVDDSYFSRKSIISILESEGSTVVGEAQSATDAIKMLGSTPSDLMIIDIVMPYASGFDLIKILNDQKYKGKYIVMSSLHSENIILESISNGALDYLQKPFEKEQLINSVEKVLTRLDE